MATPFRFKRSAVQDKRPEISDLLLGEIALNTYDGRLFGRRTGTGSTVTLLTPWSERLGAAAIYYENDVAIGATNPNGRKLYVDGNVEITGVTTFVGIVTNQSTIFASQVSVSGVSTFLGNVDLNADLDVDGRTELDTTNISETLNVVGLSTFESLVDINNRLDVVGGLNADQINAGLSSFTQLDVSTGGLDVDGQTDLDELVVAGVSTYSALVDIDNRLDVTGGANIDQLNVTGVTTLTGIVTTGTDLYVGGDLYIADDLVFDEFTARNGNITGILTVGTTLDADGTLLVTGVSTFNSLVDVNNRIDVIGGINADQVNVSGVSTYGGAVDINSDLDVDGRTELDTTNIAETLNVVGITTLASSGGITTTGGDFYVGGDLYVLDDLVFDEFTARNGNVTGILTVGTTLDLNGNLEVAGVSTLTGNVSFGSSALFGDGDTILMGDDDDLQIFHSGVTGNIKNTTGTLILQSGTVRIQDAGSSETAFSATNGVAKLYFENSEKLTTNTQGIDVTGHTETDTLNVSGIATALRFETTTTGDTNSFYAGGEAGLTADVDSEDNVMIGYRAGYDLSLSDHNIGIGREVFSSASNNSSFGNIALGGFTLQDIEGGDYNIGFGYGVLTNVTSATGNVATGAFSMGAQTTGNYNTAYGYDTLRTTTERAGNVALGAFALRDAFNADYSVAIGYNAGRDSETDNTVLIGQDAGYSASGYGGIAIGYRAGYDLEGQYNVMLGSYTGYNLNNGGGYNVGMGYAALYQDAGAREFNIALGYYALLGNAGTSTGDYNIAIGREAGEQLGSGGGNVFIGNYAGEDVTTGSNNVILKATSTNYADIDTTVSNQLWIGYNDKPWIRAVGAAVTVTYDGAAKLTTTEKGIDVTGHSELDDVNVSGVATISTLEVTQATTLKHADSVKFTTTGIGISVANGVGQTAYIEGPDEIWIDPHPVGVGTTSGVVRIRGDLYVDGRNFIVDSDTIELADFVVGIASTVPTNLLLDGAGIGIGSESIRKFIRWHNATDSLKTTENWNLASGKHYEIDGVDVLTSDTLGSGVLYSSLETLGVLRGLDVSGVSTFSSLVDVNNRIDVVGGINVDQANVTGVSTFGGNITASGDLDVDGTTDLDILNVAETATFSALVDVNNRIDIVGGANIDQVNAGLSSFTQLDVSTGGLDVDGQTDLDELVVAGVSTFSSLVDVNNRIDVVGGANVDQLNVSGVSTFTGIGTFGSDVFVDGNLNVTGDLVFDELTATHANITGVATVGTALDVNGTLDVDGDTQLDDLNVSGVSTFSGLVDVNNRIDVVGGANVDQVNVSGVSTFTGDADFGGNITVTSTDAGSSAAPEFKLYRDSSSPANADYLGQIKFAGESSTGVERNYAKITGKILDSTNGLEDGIIEIAHIKNGSQNISARFRSDSLQLLNGTNFSVNGNTELEGTLDVDGTATFDDVAVGSALTVTGIGTFQSDLYVAGNLNVIGDIVYDEVTGKNINITGVATIANLDVNGPMDVDGDTQLDDLNVSGVATFSQLVDVNNRIDVVGGANLDQLNVTGVATFTGITTFTQSIFVDGDLNVTGDLVYDEATAENLNVTGIATIASLQVTDLTDNRVVIAGSGGELEDDANFTFNGTKLSVGVELDVDGQTELDELRVAGVSTFVGMSTFTDTLSANTLSVAGVSTFIGIGSFFSDLYVGGNLNVVGDLVYDEVTGRNINITGISTFEGETNLGIGGTTLTALTNVSRVGINSTAPEYTLDVHGDINSSTDVKIGGVSVLALTASTDDVVALAIALG